MEGYLNLRIPCWQRRLITRGLALIPAFLGVWLMGDDAIGKLLILSQVVLSLQLPFALYPLIRMTGDKQLMGAFVNRLPTKALVWLLFAVISGANGWLIGQWLF
jgi:manganese transport protein